MEKDQHALDVLSQITERHRRQAETIKDGKEHAQSEDERQRMMDCLVKADQRRTAFLATLAHELRHPLAPIRNGLALLRMQGGSIEAAPIVEMMERQVSHMACLIDELLDIAFLARHDYAEAFPGVALYRLLSYAQESSAPLFCELVAPPENVGCNTRMLHLHARAQAYFGATSTLYKRFCAKPQLLIWFQRAWMQAQCCPNGEFPWS